MVKVLTILSGLDGGGVENILYNYYSRMDRTKVQMDFIVHQSVPGVMESKFIALGCKVFRVVPKNQGFLKNYNQICRIIKQQQYDIVHSRMNYKGFSQMIAAYHQGVKHRFIHNHQANMPDKHIIKRTLMTLLAKQYSTKWLACSAAAAIDMFGKKAVSQNKVIVLKNAIDASELDFNAQVRTEMRQNLNVESNFVIGMVGRFHPQKNYTFAFDAIKRYKKINPNIRFLVIGDGEMHDEIHALAVKENLEDIVIFLGIRGDMAALYQAMDVLIMPSLYEGFGNVAIEAQAAGLVTLCSDMVPQETEITELVQYLPINTGVEIWVEQIDAIYQKRYQRCSQLVNVQTAGFDINNEAKKLETLYTSMLM